MPIEIFVDTSFIIALVNVRDQYHQQALSIADEYDSQLLVITDAVILEISNALSRRYKSEAIQIIEDFFESENVKIIRLTPGLFDRGFDLYKNRRDQTWGLVDCISFIVMQERNINMALTFDRHFNQAGFKTLC
ncbi:PIN domain-containing protein [Spirulina sp. CCNP1310]|uniref:type II toxin-antitoxin system VapC family toxin n=1 Tax=Spirulina sp. CCNP1310 TaxID=3110249 RepID=UPI002B21BCB7|nr:PIN domain-containing protein [Spirulina sp. CCNP1310]MEA5418028.1 PIN domain-containing protein [Spirulina sp. CCNP1310]